MAEFGIETRWTGSLSGEAAAEGVDAALGFGVPKEFGGAGGEWTPEHLLAAAVASCIQSTFFFVAKQSKVEVKAYRSSARCGMAPGSGGYTLTGIEIAATAVVADEATRARAERALEKADSLCPISKSLGGLVTFEGTVEVEG